MSTLYYHKCNDCLTPFSSTEKHIDLCDCDGVVTFMGEVQGDKYVLTANRPACDGRCTHAHGPHCDCACQGANHGTGRLVKTVIKEGKIKVVDPGHDIHDDMVRGYKFRELREYVEKQYEQLFAAELSDKMQGNYVSRDRYNSMIMVRNRLDKILSLRVYEKRQKELLEFAVAHKKVLDGVSKDTKTEGNGDL